VIKVSRIDKEQDSLRSVSRLQAWVLAARPKTLPAALAPVLVGTALALQDGVFAWLPALMAAMGALLLQIGSNFANDYFDFFKGADTPDRLGPVRVTASGLISPGELRWGMVVVFGLAALVGLYLVAVGGWPIVAIGVRLDPGGTPLHRWAAPLWLLWTGRSLCLYLLWPGGCLWARTMCRRSTFIYG
jgi:hypothetical protein